MPPHDDLSSFLSQRKVSCREGRVRNQLGAVVAKTDGRSGPDACWGNRGPPLAARAEGRTIARG